MDKVQIYYIVILVLYVFSSGLQHGKPKQGERDDRLDRDAVQPAYDRTDLQLVVTR